jgi:hypothetical protein
MKSILTLPLISLAFALSLSGPGCMTTWHTVDSAPTVHFRGEGYFSGWKVLYLSLSNPTDKTLIAVVKCELPYDSFSGQRRIIRVMPHSDTQFSFMVFDEGHWKCTIDNIW